MKYFVQTDIETVLFDKKTARDEYAAEEILNGETNVIVGTRESIDGVPIAELRSCVICQGPMPILSCNGKKLGVYHRATRVTCSRVCFCKRMQQIGLQQRRLDRWTT